MTPDPGWYHDPQGAGLRWWDGQAWTEHVRPYEMAEPALTPESSSSSFLDTRLKVLALFVVVGLVAIVGSVLLLSSATDDETMDPAVAQSTTPGTTRASGQSDSGGGGGQAGSGGGGQAGSGGGGQAGSGGGGQAGSGGGGQAGSGGGGQAGSGGGGQADSGGGGGSESEVASFIHEADTICKALNADLAAASESPEAKVGEVVKERFQQLFALTPPPEIAVEWQQFVAKLGQAIGQALLVGSTDPAAGDRGLREAAAEIGLAVCGSG